MSVIRLGGPDELLSDSLEQAWTPVGMLAKEGMEICATHRATEDDAQLLDSREKLRLLPSPVNWHERSAHDSVSMRENTLSIRSEVMTSWENCVR